MGRKAKKNVKRTESGRPSRSKQAQAESAALVKETARLKRLREKMLKDMDNPKYGGVLGMLLMEMAIDDAEHEAGQLYETLVRRYAAMMGIGLTPQCNFAYDATERAGASLAEPPSEDAVRAVRRDYDDAFTCMARHQVIEVNRVCIRNEEPQDRHALRMGLRNLAELWGLRGGEEDQARIKRRVRGWGDAPRSEWREEMHEKTGRAS